MKYSVFAARSHTSAVASTVQLTASTFTTDSDAPRNTLRILTPPPGEPPISMHALNANSQSACMHSMRRRYPHRCALVSLVSLLCLSRWSVSLPDGWRVCLLWPSILVAYGALRAIHLGQRFSWKQIRGLAKVWSSKFAFMIRSWSEVHSSHMEVNKTGSLLRSSLARAPKAAGYRV